MEPSDIASAAQGVSWAACIALLAFLAVNLELPNLYERGCSHDGPERRWSDD